MDANVTESNLPTEPTLPTESDLATGASAPRLEVDLSNLTLYEHEEIVEYRHVYYAGVNANKSSRMVTENNFGFTGADGFYVHVKKDHIFYRYEVKDGLGRGTFGQVVKVLDHKNKKTVALKMTRGDRRNIGLAKKEASILKFLNRQDIDDSFNIVRMISDFKFRGHMCMTFDILDIDLQSLLRRTKGIGLGKRFTKIACHKLLACLGALYRNRIVHCDLKPSNIMFKYGDVDSLKVIDFGCAVYDGTDEFNCVQARYYRAPEVSFGVASGMPMDMWSLGVILWEMRTGVSLFPGRSESQHISKVIDVIDLPPPRMREGKRAFHFFDEESQHYYNPTILARDGTRQPRCSPGSKKLINTPIARESLKFVQFVEKCFEWDPKERMTPIMALEDPWILSKNYD